MKHLFFISSLIILTSTYFSRSLDYSILFLWRTITSPSFLQHTWECSRHFFFYNILPTFYIQFENVLCDYINLNDSKYSISPLKAFVHWVATIHKNEFIKNSKSFLNGAIPGIFFFHFRLFNTVSNRFTNSPMTGCQPRISGVGCDRSTNWATTTSGQ